MPTPFQTGIRVRAGIYTYTHVYRDSYYFREPGQGLSHWERSWWICKSQSYRYLPGRCSKLGHSYSCVPLYLSAGAWYWNKYFWVKYWEERINGGESKDIVESCFWKPRGSVLPPVETEGQERSLVIEERCGIGTKREQLFLCLCLEMILETNWFSKKAVISRM